MTQFKGIDAAEERSGRMLTSPMLHRWQDGPFPSVLESLHELSVRGGFYSAGSSSFNFFASATCWRLVPTVAAATAAVLSFRSGRDSIF